MNNKLSELNKSMFSKTDIRFKTGDIVRVHKKIKEGDKERIQIFKGLIIAVKGRQSSSPMITVRRESQGIGVEMIFPLFSPNIKKIDLLRHSKVRRSKLYYMRKRTGKAAKMKVKDLSEKEKEEIAKVSKKDSESKKKTETAGGQSEEKNKKKPKEKK